MFIDLTLDGFRIPGIRNFIPPFGAKEVDGAGLTTRAIVDDMMLSFLTQRPVVINETSATSEVQRNSSVVLDNGDITLKLGASGYIGCRIRIANISSGTGHIEYADTSGNQQTHDIASGREVTLTGGRQGAWFIAQ